MSEIRLRPATASDQAVIRRLVRQAGINPTGLKWPRFTLAEDSNGDVLACGQLKPHVDGSVELASLVVRPDQRGRGLARKVVETLVAQHPGDVHLMCRSGLGPFYEKFGFRRLAADEMPPYFRRVKRLMVLLEKLAGEEKLLVMLRPGGRR